MPYLIVIAALLLVLQSNARVLAPLKHTLSSTLIGNDHTNLLDKMGFGLRDEKPEDGGIASGRVVVDLEETISHENKEIGYDGMEQDYEMSLTDLAKAAKQGDLLVVKLLLDSSEYRSTGRELCQALLEATSASHIEVAKLLLLSGAEVNAITPDGQTLLHKAVKHNQLNIVSLLLEFGSDVNAADQDGQTTLHSAANNQEWEVVKRLVEKGAHVNEAYKDGHTVLHSAARNQEWEMLKWLVENGADINAADEDGQRVLHSAAKNQEWEVVKWLTEKGADINAADKDQQTVLHSAASDWELDMVKWLVEHGADERDNVKVLVQLGYIFFLGDDQDLISDLDLAHDYIDRALQIDPGNPHAWYALGRYYMQLRNYSKAYEAYQQAVNRESRYPNFWCSIGILHWGTNQYRDALDSYVRALRINHYIPEIWFNLGTLYEACNNPIEDAIDAYDRAYDVDNNYHLAKQRLEYLKGISETGNNDNSPPPQPVDIDPQRYEELVQMQILIIPE